MTNKKIAFKPHKTRGQEIIHILEGMGGINKYNLDGSVAIGKRSVIAIEWEHGNCITNDFDGVYLVQNGYKIYTLEDWEKEPDSSIIE